MTKLDTGLLRKMYRGLALTKAFNGACVDLKKRGLVPGPIHQTEGQEAVGIGACAALGPSDYVVNYYRGFAEWIYRGTDLKRLAAELLGRAPGLCGGKGGEMTLADVSVGVLSCSGIIGGSLPTGVGAAIAATAHERGQVAAVFFGDSAVNTGAFHESVNLAAVLKAPAVFVCLNNQWGISTHIYDTLAGGSIVKRADGYGMPGAQVDGQDVLAVYRATLEAVERARRGEGPSLIEAVTYRIGGHSSTSPEFDFMDLKKMSEFQKRDPLVLFRKHLLDQQLLQKGELETTDAQIAQEVQEAVDFAIAAPFPDPAEAARGVFV
jgi:pyruvate dehydrogenase E1 component alpha subunit